MKDNSMKFYDVIVIGGGPAGMMAAITAKQYGKNALLCEKMPKLGKKLLVTGAGRCNLLNDKLDSSFYDPSAREWVDSVLKRFGKEKILGFFHELGLAVYAEPDGRMFPVTNQASSVVKVLEMELERLKVPMELGFEIKEIKKNTRGFDLKAGNGERVTGNAIILCSGGKSYPALGADGGGYGFAKQFGHTLLEPVPCTVPLLVKDPWCHHLQGQKVRAVASAFVRDKKTAEASGEVLFTQYGLSGTAILDISRPISIAMNRGKITDVSVELDLVPFMTEPTLEKELARRIARRISTENLFEGLLPAKFCLAALKGTVLLNTLKGLPPLTHELKHKRFKVNGTRGWNEAEFTAGGVPAREVNPETLESKLQKGLYLAGEIVDVGGLRGGYNLAWAWASGAVAGSNFF